MKKSIENLGGRKYTGGKMVVPRGRRKYEIDRYPSEPVVGTNRTVSRRVRGNNRKLAFKQAEFANVSIPAEKKTVRSKILRVLKNPTNKDYERRGVITKGAIIETEQGQAKIISRPGQDGIVNAVIIKV
ncbi:MAG TPA: 30S ribosomal protein S8e [Nitrososphaeraceae archaeon]|jgi:small subunit ribosomal protein S8e